MEKFEEKCNLSNHNLFSIGEIAKTLGITRRIILNYEACGLIKPDKREGATGNRYYTIDTLTQIRTIRVYQSFGLSLDEIRGYFDGTTDLISLIQRLETMRDALNQNIERLCERVKSDHGSIERIETVQQTVYCRRYQATSIAERTSLLRNTALEAMRLYGMASNSRWYSIEHNYMESNSDYAFYVVVPPESQGEHICKLPAQKALSIYHHGPYEGIPAVAETLLAYAKENGLRTQGNICCVYLEGPPQHQDPSKFVTQVVLLLAD